MNKLVLRGRIVRELEDSNQLEYLEFIKETIIKKW